MKVKCIKDIVAINGGEKLFIKDREYPCEKFDGRTRSGIIAVDEFNCPQTLTTNIADDKEFKKYFEII